MNTYRDLVYMVLDELKLVSDDSHFKEEHILFLLNSFRPFLLKQRYSDIRKEIPDSNYQTICLDLQKVQAIEGVTCGLDYLKSVQQIPKLVEISTPKITSVDYFQGNFTYVNDMRFKYAGASKYLKNQIYGTIAPDSHLYMKSNNPQAYYLGKVKLTGIFEDSIQAAELACDSTKTCDIMDATFPLESALVPTLIELIVKEIGGQKYQSEDNENNSKDDLSTLAAFIRQALANGRRSDLYKDYS